ncbi:MAG: hypothetical protein ACU0CT_18020 [Paracoccaceae bacterium]|nr:hypothetical protein [Paracoccaceae bacterium]
MPDATRNRIISTPEPLGVSEDSHLHEGASRGHLWHEAEAQKIFRKLPVNASGPKRTTSFLQKGTQTGSQKPSENETPIMMMKTRYEPHEVQDGQKTLQAFLDDLKALDVLPKLQPPGMEPATYMCAANMDALTPSRRLDCSLWLTLSATSSQTSKWGIV